MSMTQTEKHNVPALRFPEFSGKWFSESFGSFVVKIKESYNPSKSLDDWPCIELESLGQGNGQILQTFQAKDLQSIKTKFQPGDVLFGKLRPYFKKYALVDFEGVCTSEIWVLRASKISSPFLYYIVQSPKFNQYANIQSGSKMPRSDWNIVSSATYSLPTNLPEQQKIASFLSQVDRKIAQLGEKKALLQAYKKGMMQKLFSQELRFKDPQGHDFPDWEEKRLGEVFDRITRKNKNNNTNVLTISAQMGLVNQMNYFNHSVAAKDLTGYYLLEKGDFAYNKSYSKGYPMGAIKRLKAYDSGVVSTLYICFKSKNPEMQPFFEKLFDSGYQNRWIHKIAQEGARNHGLLNMAVGDFFEIPLPFPSPPEQQKIADFLSSIDRKIDLVATELDHAKTFKKGLLQQMFI